MVCGGNRREWTGYGMVRKSGCIYLKLVDGFSCRKLPAKRAEMRWTYVIRHSTEVYSGALETERSRSFVMQMIIHRSYILAVSNDCMHFAYNFWAPNDDYYGSKVNVNRVSMIHSHTHSVIKRLHSGIHPKRMYWTSWQVNRKATRSLLHPSNEHQWGVNDFWSCILDKHPAVHRH